MKALIAVLVMMTYLQFKGTIIEIIARKSCKQSFYLHEIYFSLSKLLDACIAIEVVVIFLLEAMYYQIIITVLLASIVKNKMDSIKRKSEKHLSGELVKLMIESYYHISIGSRFDYFIFKIKDNDLIDYILRHKEPLDTRISKLSRSLQINEFNRYITLIRRMDYFDSDKILYELESLIQLTLDLQFQRNKKYAEKLNEMFVFPMAINLISMSLMLVYPYLKEWF